MYAPIRYVAIPWESLLELSRIPPITVKCRNSMWNGFDKWSKTPGEMMSHVVSTAVNSSLISAGSGSCMRIEHDFPLIKCLLESCRVKRCEYTIPRKSQECSSN